jgi:hypothetical protein
MGGAIRLNAIDLTIFAAYMVAAVALGFLVSRRGRTSSKAYFLGGKTLPWYVVATSMVAADVSAEHFIANAGVAYRYGIVPATGSWNTWIIYSLFIWIFLPYYVRTGLYTVPSSSSAATTLPAVTSSPARWSPGTSPPSSPAPSSPAASPWTPCSACPSPRASSSSAW